MTIHFFTSTDPEKMFQEETIIENLSKINETIAIDPSQKGQRIDGFGASFTDSAAFLIDKKLSESEKEKVMTQLFDPQNGIGLSLLRNPMGASDYARTIYSYDDQLEGATDDSLADFSIAHDYESILPLTKWAQKLNPELKVFASPWSAPGWMKDSRKMVTGRLKKEYYALYAQYFVKFIEAYQAAGVEIYAVTPQNEPLFEPKNYPGMFLPAAEESLFVGNYLRPAFLKAGLATKIFGYDHNWDRLDYAFDLLDAALTTFDGIAWHWYGGQAKAQTRVAAAFPEKEIHFTEGSGGEWILAFEPAFSNLMRQGIDILRNGSRSFILWNMALDENNGPTVPGFGRSTCRGLLKIDQQTSEYAYSLDYYGLAHFSKYVRPQAQRLVTSQSETVKNVAFENKDGSLVVVLFNDSQEEKKLAITLNKEKLATVSLPAKAAGTFLKCSE